MAALWRRLHEAPTFLQGLDGWRRAVAALVFGGAAALAMAPLGYWPALFLAFTGVAWLLAGCRSAVAGLVVGYLFSYAFLVASLFWIASAFFVDAARFAWLSPLPVLGLPAVLAVFPALPIALLVRIRLTGWPFILGLALAWSVGEFLRGRLFTGFPWNAIGYAWADAPAMMQAAAFVGVDGLGLATVFLTAAPAILGLDAGRRSGVGGLVVVAVVSAVGIGAGEWRLNAANDVWPGVKIRLVQGNVAQREKFKGGLRAGKDLMNSVKLCSLAESLGAVETMITHPATMTHVEVPKAERIARGLSDGVVRLSVGIEHKDDIIHDLRRALTEG